jgi:hypothetical protein
VRPISLGWLVLVLALSPSPAASAASAAADPRADRDSSYFTISQDGRAIGREEFVHYVQHDTVFSYSTVTLDGLPKDSPVPLVRRTTFLQRRTDSYPMFFETISTPRDSAASLAISCVFSDTTVVVYREINQRGLGEALALPPGRLYILDPGVYHPMQLLMADFLGMSQDRRQQKVFIGANNTFATLSLTRGIQRTLRAGGRERSLTSVQIKDENAEFVGWLDGAGRMWRLEAVGQGLTIERAPETKQGAAPKRSASKSKKKR